MTRPAVFLDRDGTLIEEVGYLGDPAGVRLIPGARGALARLRAAGYALVVISNQGGVAKGLFDDAAVAAVNARVDELLGEGAPDAWYWCSHHPSVGDVCGCRKPGTELIEGAARDLDLDVPRSWMIGDHPGDVECARRAGARGILVLTGHAGHGATDGHVVASDIASAADLILDG